MSEQDIQNFVEFTNGDRSTAEIFLKANDGDLIKAVEEFFVNPSPHRFKDQLSWHEGSFAAGRHGATSQMDALPPFQMDEDQRNSRALVPFGAPSRPPSRDQSRMSFRGTGPAQDTEMVQYNPAQLGEEMDADMKEAIRLSMQDQQTGIIDASGNEYVPDAEASERQRLPGDPAFLKPLPGNRFLPCLITILFSIPQCREMMYSRHDVLHDYGENKRWWEGEDIQVTRIIALDEEIDPLNQIDVIHEVQRLMAFLGGTNRSYGSVSSLSRLKAVQLADINSTGSNTGLIRFMVAWQSAIDGGRTEYEFEHVFQSIVQGEKESSIENLYLVDIDALDIPTETNSTLYDALDNCFWRGNSGGKTTMDSFLSRVSPIVVMRLAARNQQSRFPSIGVPPVLYADRYLESSQEVVQGMRVEVEQSKTIVDDFENKLGKLELLQNTTTGKVSSATRILEKAVSYIEERERSNNNDNTGGDRQDEQDMQQDDETALHASEVLNRLQSINEELQARVNLLKEEKDKIEASMKSLTKLLTDPNDDSGPKPTRAYYLRGVGIATSNQSQTTYALHPSSTAMSTDKDRPIEVWWRMSYDTAGEKALVSKEEVTEKSVLEAAGELLSETLLVYACDDMLDQADEEALPSGLQEFVALDNAAFRQEIEDQNLYPTIIEGRPIELDGIEEGDNSVPGLIRDTSSAPEANMAPKYEPQTETVDPSLLSNPHDDYRESQGVQEMREISSIVGNSVLLNGQAAGRHRGGGLVRDEEMEYGDGDVDSDTATIGSNDGVAGRGFGFGGDGAGDVEMGGVGSRSGRK